MLVKSKRIEEGERQWQNYVSFSVYYRLRGRPKSNGTINANKKWFDEEIFLLIDAWREKGQLFHVKHPKYHLKDKRTKNLRLLAQLLSEKNVEATISQISKKMLSLKNHFSSEKRKVKASSKKCGSGASR